MAATTEPWSAIESISAESGATVNINVTINQGDNVEEAIRLWFEMVEMRLRLGDSVQLS